MTLPATWKEIHSAAVMLTATIEGVNILLNECALNGKAENAAYAILDRLEGQMEALTIAIESMGGTEA